MCFRARGEIRATTAPRDIKGNTVPLVNLVIVKTADPDTGVPLETRDLKGTQDLRDNMVIWDTLELTADKVKNL
jgi:hypothetical protein